MRNQKNLIHEKRWNYLIVLDACRYDFFKKLYRDYFEGESRKIVSPGSETTEWCKKVFCEMHEDIVYISSNPRINSKTEVRGFNASEHFHKVIDVWDWGWNDKKETVLPEEVNKATLEARERNPGKKIISHYMQPHAPYLSFEYEKKHNLRKNPNYHNPNARFHKIRNLVGGYMEKVLGAPLLRKLRECLGTKKKVGGPIGEVITRGGEKKLLEAYKKNLETVLDCTSKLCDRIDGKIIITSDHGERLKKEKYGHEPGSKDNILREVPWLELNN